MEDCIFCKIIKERIENPIAESENFIAIKDKFPKTKGHTLIISKKHYEKFTDLPKELYQELLELTNSTIEKLETKNFNIANNNGKIEYYQAQASTW
jgi:histidine triad (HIT) family protein